MFIDPTHISLMGTVITGVGSAITGIIVWLVKSGASTMRRFNKLDLKFHDVSKDVEVLKDGAKTSDTRIVKIEDAISDIRAAVQRSDEQFKIIAIKLDQLPRVTTLLEQNAIAIAAIVPRAEVDARLKSHETRLDLVERDIREGRSS